MKKIFSLKSPKEHYRAVATVLWCFDARFTLAALVFLVNIETLMKNYDGTGKMETVGFFRTLINFVLFLKRRRFAADIIFLAGGVKEVFDDEKSTIGRTEKSLNLHHADRIVIMAHDECGAYSGKTGEDFYMKELEKGETILKKFFTQKIIKVFCDFSGVYQV